MSKCNRTRNDSINSILNKFHRLRSKVLAKRISELNLSLLQASTLRALYYIDGCIQREMCERMEVAPSVMVNLLGTLEEMGLIERRNNPQNRRILNIFITDKGREVSEQIYDIVGKTDEEYLSDLTPEERDELLYLLRKSYHSWEKHCME